MFGPLLSVVLQSAGSKPQSANLEAAEAPMAMAGHGLYIRMRVAGKPYWFYLDSDSYCSTVNPAIVKQLKGVREITVDNSDPDVGTTVAEVDAQVGGVHFDRQRFFESNGMTRALPSPSASEPLGGLLGYNVLRLLSVGIDFDHWRLWVWGPGNGNLARKAFFGEGGSAFVSPIKMGGNGAGECRWVVGGAAGAAELDTGSFWSSIPREDASKMGKHLAVGGSLTVTTPGGSEGGRLGAVDEITIGDLNYKLPLLEVEPGSTGRVIGWSMFRPLGRVLIDFEGGRIDRAAGPSSISPLGFFLSIGGIRQVDEKTLIQGDTVIPTSSVTSINGVSVSPGDWTWVDPLAKFTKGTRQGLRYRDNRGVQEISAIPDTVIGPYPDAPVTSNQPEPAEVPGYYLDVNGRATRLPYGDLFVPAGDFRVVAVGGIPPPVLVGRQGAYTRYELPVPVDHESWSRLFGWTDVTGPIWVSSAGEALHPDQGVSHAAVPVGDAFSPDNWKWRISPDGLSAVLNPRSGK